MKDEFNQKQYTKNWDKENMKQLKVSYRKEFVEEFRESCKKLEVKQSDVFRQAMNATIDKAKKEEG